MGRIVLCLSGRPASGKSTAARILRDRAGWGVIESGKVVANLLRSRAIHALGERDQAEFRRTALALVRGSQPTKLVRALSRALARAPSRVVIVGVRNMSTLDGLRGAGKGDVRVVYIATTLRNCSRRYARRDRTAQGRYLEIVRNPVEAEQKLLRRSADVVIDNNSTIRAFRNRVMVAVARLLR